MGDAMTWQEPVEPGDLRAGDRVAYTYRWKRYEGALVVTTMRRQPITTLEHAGLLVTFEGRWAGGISDVRLIEPAPADVDPEPKAELDEVEALAMDLYHASLLLPPVKEIGPSAWLSEQGREMWLGVARAAREHTEAERIDAEAKRDQWKADVRDAAIARADKALVDLARVTGLRDKWERLAHEMDDNAKRHCARADRAEGLHKALREDVDRLSARDPLITPLDILARDDERAES